MTPSLIRFVFALFVTFCCGLPGAFAQFRVDVSGVGLTQVPIAFANFRDEQSSPQKIAAIVQADLERSGQFRGLAAGQVLDETARPDKIGRAHV